MITKTQRGTKILLGLLLAFLIALVPISSRANSGFPEAEQLKIGYSKKVTLEAGRDKHYKYTPAKDQAVELYVKGNPDDFGIMIIDENDVSYNGEFSQDEYNSASEFMALKGGKTYYFSVNNWTEAELTLEVEFREADFGVLAPATLTAKDGETITIEPFIISNKCKIEDLEFHWTDEDGNEFSNARTIKYKVSGKNTYMMCYINDGSEFEHSLFMNIDIDNGLMVEEVDVVIECGQDVEFVPDIKAYQKDGMEYKWLDYDFEELKGETNPTLKLKNVTKAATYFFEVTDKYGNYGFCGCHVGIKNDMTIKDNGPVIVKSGSDAVLKVSVTADNTTNLKYEWTEAYLDEDDEEILGTTDTFTVKNVTKSRYFDVVVEDCYGNREFTTVAAWVDNNFKVSSDKIEYYINKGDSVELKVNASANDMSGIKYSWYSDEYLDNGEFDYSSYKEYESKTNTLKLENIQKPMHVVVTVTDKFGSELSLEYRISFDKDPNQGLKDFVARIYKYVLDREPEEGGALYWESELYNFNRSGAEVAQGFIFSPEFEARNTTDEEFVTILYKTFFGREPDVAGMTYWLTMLQSATMDRPTVANGFIFSQEWADTCASYGIRSGGDLQAKVNIEPKESTLKFVERMYTTAMKRESDEEGKKYWASELANFRTTGEACGALFFLSDEMTNLKLDNKEFITRLYLTFMDREPDADGLAYWLSQLDAGATRDTAVYGFSRSPEFTQICIQSRILPY